MKRLLTLLLSLLSLSTISIAEVIGASSLEWLADHCIESGVYEVTEVIEKENKTQIELSLTLKKSLRGDPSNQLKETYYIVKLSDPKRSAAQKGDEFLICFKHYSTTDKRAIQTINLDNPQIAGFMNIAATSEMKLLKTKQDILKVFEDRIKSHPKGNLEDSDNVKDTYIDLDNNSELFQAIWSGSSCHLLVPKDLMEKAKSESKRLEKESIKVK